MRKLLFVFAFFMVFTSFSQTKPTYNIGILLDYRTAKLEPILLELQKEITAVVGEDANVIFSDSNILVNRYSLEKAKENYTILLNSNTDIIIAFGAVNIVVISKLENYEKPTILFGSRNEGFDSVNVNNNADVSNLTSLMVRQSFGSDLSTLKELTSFTTVGIAIEAGLVDVLSFESLLDKETKELGVNYILIPYVTSDDITKAINQDIDAFYLANAFFLNKNDITKIASKLIEEKIPSFTSTRIEDVVNGLMATNQSNDNLNQFFRRIALTVESYVNGQVRSNGTVLIQYDDRLTVNNSTAKSVGVSIKFSLLGKTNFVGNFENGLAEKKYNLLDVMQTVVGENLSLQVSKRDIALSEQDVKASKSDYYPSVVASSTGAYVDPKLAAASLGQAPEFRTSGAITLEQTIFSNAANANISIQKELLKGQEEVYNIDQLDAILDVSNVYFNALILKANLQIQNQNLNLTKKNLQISKQNFEAGQAGKSDVLRFRSEQAQNTQSLVEAVNQLQQTYFLLNQLLNNPINLQIDVDEAELGEGILKNYNYLQLKELIDDVKLRGPFIEYLVKFAKENAPEIKSLNYNLNAAQRSLKLNSAGRFLPTLALQGEFNREFGRSGAGSEFLVPNYPLSNYNVGVNISVPIFNRTLTNINRQTATIQKDQLTINKENVALSIEINVNKAILNLFNEIANIETSKVSEEAAKESLELTQVSYANGSVNIVQLLDAQNNYLSSRLSKINAVYNYLSNSIQLERVLGYYFLLHSPEENQAFIQGFNDFLQNKN